MWASASVYQDRGLEYERAEHWGAIDDTPTIDESCRSAHASDPWVCLDHMHVLLHHISTPLFLIAQLRDPAVMDGTQHRYTTTWDASMCDPGATCCHDENYLTPMLDCERSPGAPHYFSSPADYTPEAFERRVLATMRALRTGFPTRSEMAPGCTGSPCDASSLPTVPHGAFIDDIQSHGSIENTDKAVSVMNGRTLETHLVDWIERGTDTFCVDVSRDRSQTSGTGAAWGACPSES
jgi:hypothetical protein